MTELVESSLNELILSDSVDCPVTHHFNDGVYIREVFIPKDTIALGYKHKLSCINILSKGKMYLIDVTTGEESYIEAPMTFITEGGVQKLAYTLEDCVFSNIHSNPDNLQDIDKLEEIHIYKENIHELYDGSRSSNRSSFLNNGSSGSS